MHGFVAGDIATRESSEDTQIVAFSWAGGMLDVFKCDSIFTQHDNKVTSISGRREQVIDRLSAAGEDEILALIRNLLSTSEDDEMLEDALWRDAWEECRNTFRRSWEEGESEEVKDIPEAILEGIRTPCDCRFTNMSQLLWLFAKC